MSYRFGGPFRSAALVLAVTAFAFHGRIYALEGNGHVPKQPLSDVTVMFYQGLTAATGPIVKRGKLLKRAVTDSDGRFTLPDVREGYYIYTLSSSDVPRVEGLTFVDPARPRTLYEIFTCSKRFNHSCGTPFPE